MNIHDNIIGAVVAFPLEVIGQNFDLAGLQIGAYHAPASTGTLFRALAANEPSQGVEGVAIAASAVGAEDRQVSIRGQAIDTVAEDVAEEQVVVRVESRPF